MVFSTSETLRIFAALRLTAVSEAPSRIETITVTCITKSVFDDIIGQGNTNLEVTAMNELDLKIVPASARERLICIDSFETVQARL